MFNNIEFAQPDFLYLLLLIPLLIVWYWREHHKNNADIQVSSTQSFENVRKSFKQRFYHSLFVLRLLALILLIIAFSRPQSSTKKQNITIKGIDIIIAMDISGSMLAEDFTPNRLEASKNVAEEFINGRKNDRIGLVVFSGESFTQCPLTTDHAVLINLFKNIKSGMIQGGTAIGDGLATAVNRLKNSKAVSKVIILLTDGVNNSGSIDPISAAEIAKLYGIRVYTIGMGTRGKARTPVAIYPNGQYAYDYVKVDIDEKSLRKIAQITNGRYFRATNNKKLEEIYKQIDKLEKSKINVNEFSKKKEEFLPYALCALVLLSFEIILKNTVFKTIP